MKKITKTISLLLVLMLVSKTPFVVLADELDSDSTDNAGSSEVVLDEATDDTLNDDEATKEEDTDEPTDDETNEESDDEADDDSKKNKSNNGLGKLNKEQKKQLQQERKMLREQLKSAYTLEDLEKIQEINAELKEKYNGIKILPIDSIISNRYQFKFDVPPVVKDQRTLVPVRAITETFGCDVTWNGETQTVTINKTTTSSSIEIEMVLNDNIVIVNGEQIELDTEATLFNNRTFVPLRFIAEIFNLEVNWYGEDETIEIIEPDEDSDEDNSGEPTDSEEDGSGEPTDSDEDGSGEPTDSEEDGSGEPTDSDEDSTNEATDSANQSI